MPDTDNQVQGKQEKPENKFFALFGETIAKEGVAPIPLALLRYQKELEITPGEMGFIVHLLSYRWRGDRVPHPSLEKMSELTGMSVRVLHKYKTSLLEKKLIEVQNRYHKESGAQLTNEYDFTPLFKKLCEIIKSYETEDSHHSKNSPEPVIRIPVVVPEKSPGDNGSGKNGEQNGGGANCALAPMNSSDTSNNRGAHCAPSPMNQSNKDTMGCKTYTPGVNPSELSNDRDAQCAEGGMHNLRTGACTECSPPGAQCADEINKGQVDNGQVEKGQVNSSPYGDATRPPGTQREETDVSKAYGSAERIQEVSPCSKDIPEGIERSSSVSNIMQGTERKGSTAVSDNKDTGTPKKHPSKEQGNGSAAGQPRNNQKVVSDTKPASESVPPTNQQLIAELVRKFRELPGVKPERGHYPMVGKCYNKFGYEAVQGAIEDLMYEFMWRQDQGMPVLEGKQLWAYFVKKCQWNYRPPLTEEEREARKKPLYDPTMYEKMPDGSLRPRTLAEILPPGAWIEGNTIHIPKQEPARKGDVRSAAAN